MVKHRLGTPSSRVSSPVSFCRKSKPLLGSGGAALAAAERLHSQAQEAQASQGGSSRAVPSRLRRERRAQSKKNCKLQKPKTNYVLLRRRQAARPERLSEMRFFER